MYMYCSLCAGAVSRLSAKKIEDGFVCSRCLQKLPKSIMKNIGSYTSDRLKTITDYMNSVRKDLFFPTASFGSLHIDEIHGMFAIADRLGDNYMELTDVFECLLLKDVGLTPTNVSVNKSNQVFCDFELHCWFEFPKCSFTVPVRKKVRCPSQKKNHNEISCQMPGDYIIFIQMFDRMLDAARKKFNVEQGKHFMSYASFELLKAESLFMLGESYDLDQVESQRNILERAFAGQDNYIKIIRNAYYVLLNKTAGGNADE